MKKFKKLIKVFLFVVILLIIGFIIPGAIVSKSCKGKVFDSVQLIRHNKVGLLLGTSKYLRGGKTNLYYKYRIDAAIQLFDAGKIDYILVSGDNRKKNYDEPTTMKSDLVAAGIPASKIFLDYAGFRTLDSVVRSKYIFSQDSITIISQRFHNERAIFLAKRKGIEAVGFNAKDVNFFYGFKTKSREELARVKMFLDLMFNKEPKFYGDKVDIK
jgi:SanA protein